METNERPARIEEGQRWKDGSGPYTLTQVTNEHTYRFRRDGTRDEGGGIGLCNPLLDEFLGYAPDFGPQPPPVGELVRALNRIFRMEGREGIRDHRVPAKTCPHPSCVAAEALRKWRATPSKVRP